MLVKFNQPHTHKSNSWQADEIANVRKEIAIGWIAQGIAASADPDCGCGTEAPETPAARSAQMLKPDLPPPADEEE